MPVAPGDHWRRLRWVTKTFLVLAVIYAALYVSRVAPLLQSLAALATLFFGLLSLVGLVRRSLRRAIWLLRNRLIVAYLMIAVVPIVLGLVLVSIASWAVIGQMAVYLVNSELERRISFLTGPVEGLLRLPGANPQTAAAQFAPLIQRRFPDFAMLIQGKNEVRFPAASAVQPPPAGWQEANGLVLKDGKVYAWVHSVANGGELTLLAPVTHDLLSHLIPGLGDIDLVPYTARSQQSLVPPKQNPLDFELSMIYPVPIDLWDQPPNTKTGVLLVDTRVFAVLDTMFGAKSQWFETLTGAFVVVSILFLLVELASLVAGVRLSRSITGAVHELYAGTQHVKEGNFTYRIPVRGDDQLAELTASFNTMTENLGRLLVVAKEKERLQSELAIAREVQAQLFPKAPPPNRTLQLSAVCKPARAVSGDYYDYMAISEGAVALAIGDVAGKGISAALLMATLQSSLRTQLQSWLEVAAAAGNGSTTKPVSTSRLVGRLNNQLYAYTSPEKYATFCLGVFDEQ